ncbi:MAG TPA: helix-turn-helix transcriptional regulator [Candidatus Binatia bacterium]|nr:helix-turn-helix transcriptional regulator [Candidatus Binatia bacterium]
MGRKQTFGAVIRERRKELHLTQRDVADRVAARLKDEERRGFDFSYLSKIENDRLPPPSTPAIVALAAVLELSADELLALAGKTPPDIGEKFKQSEGARMFFRSAINLGLSENDWKELLATMKRKKGRE